MTKEELNELQTKCNEIEDELKQPKKPEEDEDKYKEHRAFLKDKYSLYYALYLYNLKQNDNEKI